MEPIVVDNSIIVWTVVLVIVQLGTHLFFQVIFRLVDLFLETVTGVGPGHLYRLRRLGRALVWKLFLFFFLKLLQPRGSTSRVLKGKHRVLQRHVSLMHRPVKATR
jgi:hypothetical protein